MFDLSKIGLKVVVPACLLILVIFLIIWFTVVLRDEPLKINGRDYGFATGALEAENKRLRDENEKLADRLKSIQAQVQTAGGEAARQSEANQGLRAQLDELQKQAELTWFPLDDVQFLPDGTCSSREMGGKVVKKWALPNVGFALQALSLGYEELLLGTNLPPPGNRLRMNRSTSEWLITSSPWQYRVTAISMFESGASVRIERRALSVSK